MHSRFRLLSLQIKNPSRFHSSVHTTSNPTIPSKILETPLPIHHYHQITDANFTSNQKPTNPNLQTQPTNPSTDHEALKIQTLIKNTHSPEQINQRLNEHNLSLSSELVLNVLKRHRSNWKPAYAFFRWLCRSSNSTGFYPATPIYNEILDTLGRMKRFEELHQVLDEMSSRKKNLINERTYSIVVSRLCGAHKVDEAIRFFTGIQDLGLDRDLFAFQTLLLSLCRYKHVEAAEFLFRNKRGEFEDEIKTWNIILNGWCVLRSLPDAKRFWKDMIASDCKPDKFSFGIFINALSKSGKISTAKKLLTTMWEEGCKPDVTICNTVIDGLCFKKRIPEALEIFGEMREKGCEPNSATYNTLIKHLCKIGRFEEVGTLLKEMEDNGDEDCGPNCLTYGYLLKAAKKAEEVERILERMKERGLGVDGDTYNLVLRLMMEWGDEERVRWIWNEMERNGFGPDRRSYTIVIHGFCERGMKEAALEYVGEMRAKGMEPESRTKLLVGELESRDCKLSHKQGEKNRSNGDCNE